MPVCEQASCINSACGNARFAERAGSHAGPGDLAGRLQLASIRLWLRVNESTP
jgi:hypothetical protein